MDFSRDTRYIELCLFGIPSSEHLSGDAIYVYFHRPPAVGLFPPGDLAEVVSARGFHTPNMGVVTRYSCEVRSQSDYGLLLSKLALMNEAGLAVSQHLMDAVGLVDKIADLIVNIKPLLEDPTRNSQLVNIIRELSSLFCQNKQA